MLTAQRVTEKIYLIHGEREAKYPFCHGLLIDADVKVLIDSGFGRRAREEVQAYMDVDVIINTHFHYDHTNGNRYFPRAEIWAHHLDAHALCSEESFLDFSGLGRVVPPAMMEKYFPDLAKDKPVTRELNDGETLDFGGVKLQVVHLPGHTPGHIGFHLPGDGIFFSSDIDVSSFGPWYASLCSSLPLFIASVRKVRDLNPRILVTSHTGIITDRITERLAAFEAAFEERNRLILNSLTVEKSLDELVEENLIYKKFVKPEKLIRFFERLMLEKHLHYLISDHKIICAGNNLYQARV